MKERRRLGSWAHGRFDILGGGYNFVVAIQRKEPSMKAELRSEIACPHCGYRKIEEMPTDACRFFYECEGCGALLRPKPGDCCVFCSYGSTPCPPVQLQRRGDGHESCCQ